jgi:hypothetical protein
MPILGVVASARTRKPVVTGGTLTSDATYYYRTFTANGTLGVTGNSLTADSLVIAGGAGGGYSTYFSDYDLQLFFRYGGAGGGAGGVLLSSNQTLSPNNYSLTVGAGGTSNGAGSNSVFNANTAVGGAFGPTSTGGSGGGGYSIKDELEQSMTYVSPGAGTSGQGNSGGTVTQQGFVIGAGGGGASGAGGATSNANGGAGGAGTNAYSSWASTTGTGSSGFYAGGGGGGSASGGSGGSSGGGGSGAGGVTNTAGSAADANTGSGGGGGGYATTANSLYNGGAGGSGLVIIRYTKAQVD